MPAIESTKYVLQDIQKLVTNQQPIICELRLGRILGPIEPSSRGLVIFHAFGNTDAEKLAIAQQFQEFLEANKGSVLGSRTFPMVWPPDLTPSGIVVFDDPRRFENSEQILQRLKQAFGDE